MVAFCLFSACWPAPVATRAKRDPLYNEERLTQAVIARIMGFEGTIATGSGSDWVPTGGTVASSTLHAAEGTHSVVMSGASYITLLSTQLSALGSVGNSMSLQIWLPSQLVGQSNKGQVQATFNSASLPLYSATTTTVPLSSLTPGQFSTVTIPLDASIYTKLSQSGYTDLTIQLAFTLMDTKDQTFVDKLAFATGSGGTGGSTSTGGTSATSTKATGGTGGTSSGLGGTVASGGTTATLTTGGTKATGGTSPSGGNSSTSGTKTSGGTSSGGTLATGGTKATGGTSASGGTVATGGTTGTKATGGTSASGGTSGTQATGGTSSTGGTSATGGTKATGGSFATGGTLATGGSLGTGGVIVYTGGTSATGGIANSGGSSTTASGGITGTGGTSGTATASGGVTTAGGATATGGQTGSGGTSGMAGASAYTFSFQLPAGVNRNQVVFATTGGDLWIDDGVKAINGSGYASVSAVNGGKVNRIGVGAQVQNVWSNGDVQLANNAIVHGSLYTTGALVPQSGAQVLGLTAEDYDIGPLQNISWAVTFPPNTLPAVNLETAQALTPGGYPDYDIKTGGQLNLTNGTYYFQSLMIEPGGTLQVNNTQGPVFIYMQNAFTQRGTVNTSSPGTNVLFGLAGTSPVSIGTSLNGILVAPAASVSLETLYGSTHQGAVFAKSITAHQNTTTTTLQSLQPINFCGTTSGCSSFVLAVRGLAAAQ